MELPYSAAAERNKAPIWAILDRHLQQRRQVLEIGSGSGQHAIHCVTQRPSLRWQCSELAEALPGLRAQLQASGLQFPPPIELDVQGDRWPAQRFEIVFTANTLHIMSMDAVQALFRALPAHLAADPLLVVYGPFRYRERALEPSNAEFDAALRRADARRGLRCFEEIDALAATAGLQLLADHAMPANNRCLVWHRAQMGG